MAEALLGVMPALVLRRREVAERGVATALGVENEGSKRAARASACVAKRSPRTHSVSSEPKRLSVGLLS